MAMTEEQKRVFDKFTTKPRWMKDAVLTKRGWVNPKTNETLLARRTPEWVFEAMNADVEAPVAQSEAVVDVPATIVSVDVVDAVEEVAEAVAEVADEVVEEVVEQTEETDEVSEESTEEVVEETAEEFTEEGKPEEVVEEVVVEKVEEEQKVPARRGRKPGKKA